MTTAKLNDHQTLQTLQDEMNAALEAVAKKHDLVIRVGSCSYAADGNEVTYKLRCQTQENASNPIAKEERALREIYGAEVVGKEFTFEGKTYTLAGYRTRARRFPFIGKDEKGKFVAFADGVVQSILDEGA